MLSRLMPFELSYAVLCVGRPRSPLAALRFLSRVPLKRCEAANYAAISGELNWAKRTRSGGILSGLGRTLQPFNAFLQPVLSIVF